MRNVFKHPGKTAYICPEDGRSETYMQLNRNADRTANALLGDDNIGKDAKVMYSFRNSPEFIYIYIACMKMRAVGCPIDPGAPPAETAAVIDESKPDIFIYDYCGDTELALSMARYKPKILIVSGYPKNKKMLKGRMRFEDILQNASSEDPDISSDIYRLTTHFHTSGTTGHPKCVPVADINEVMSAREVMVVFGTDSGDVMINISPWHHRGGLHCFGPSTVFYAGGTAVIMKEFDAERCLEYIERYRITYVAATPVLLCELASAQAERCRNLASVKSFVTMGSILSKTDSERCRRILGEKIYNIYGTTETFFNTVLTPYDMVYMPGTVGRPCTDDEIRIVKISDRRRSEPDDVIEPGEIGEIIIRSPSKSTSFYYNNDTETLRKFYKGWMYSGDLGSIDKDGFISVVGRTDDMIISRGEKIYPVYIEETLSKNPKVGDCIVTSVPDPVMGEAITAMVVKADESLTAEELDAFCLKSRMITRGSRPVYYRFKKTIPRTASGKKLRRQAKKNAVSDLKKGRLTRIGGILK